MSYAYVYFVTIPFERISVKIMKKIKIILLYEFESSISYCKRKIIDKSKRNNPLRASVLFKMLSRKFCGNTNCE